MKKDAKKWLFTGWREMWKKAQNMPCREGRGSCCLQTQLVPDRGSPDGGPGPAVCCCLLLSQQSALLLGLPRGYSPATLTNTNAVLYLRALLLSAAVAGGPGGGFRWEHSPSARATRQADLLVKHTHSHAYSAGKDWASGELHKWNRKKEGKMFKQQVPSTVKEAVCWNWMLDVFYQ